MGKKLTQEEFIKRCKKIHDDRYDYSLVNYINNYTKIIIICKKHGEFLQEPQNHLNNHGCNKCGRNICANKTSLSNNDFIQKAIKIHGNKYNYSKTEYINSNKKVIIICSTHKEFLQKPNSHLNGAGCIKCAGYYQLTEKEFINQCKKIHKNKYNYSQTEYKHSRGIITIICKIHGKFLLSGSTHIKGGGCIHCTWGKSGWNSEKWERQAESSKNFDSFKIYIIRCWNENEEFYKIGKTFRNIKERLNNHIPYNYEIIKTIESKNGKYISQLEKKLQKENKEFKYLPKINFEGKYECFSKIKL